MNTRTKIFLPAAAALLLATGAFAQHDHGKDQACPHAAATAAAPEKVTDPVCGMVIDPATAAGKSVYEGKTYYFCSKDEKEKFDKNPQKYVKKK
jgi:YHS domain-containing protein